MGLLLSTGGYAESDLPEYLQTAPFPALPHQTLRGLNTFLSRYQAEANRPWPRLSEKHLLKPGMHEAVIGQIRERLETLGDLTENESRDDPTRFDPELKEAVQHFQQRMGLNADGVIGNSTLQELNIAPSERMQQIEVNIERWQALAQKAGGRFVLVNVPDFRLFVYDNGENTLSMKAIVGRPSRQTPEIDSQITHIIFNPWWNVPKLIARKDIVPKVLDDPDYLDDMHIRIFSSQEANAREIPQDSINWDTVAEKGFPWFFRQDPGNDNALGRVKFEFRNADSIYLHDTPTRNLFDLPVRDFSSGCVRLENPLALVEDLMQPDTSWSEVRMQTLLDNGKTAYVKMKQPVPVFITYLTAWVDDQGVLNFRKDIYHRDQPNDADDQDDDSEDVQPLNLRPAFFPHS